MKSTYSHNRYRLAVGVLTTSVVLSFLAAGLGCAPKGKTWPAYTYPEARRCDQVDDYHGLQVADPYRWLENSDSDETRAWIEAENAITFAHLKNIPARERIRKRLTELWDFDYYGASFERTGFFTPVKRGGRYFFAKRTGLQNQGVLYMADSLDGEPTVLLDPNTLSEDGTVTVSGAVLTKDGTKLAYGVSVSGSDWQEWYVRDVATRQDMSDHLKWIKFTPPVWTPDGKGFFYGRYDEPDEKTKYEDVNFFQKLYFHKLGTSQAKDVLVYDRPDEKTWTFTPDVTEDGKYLLVYITRSTDRRARILYQNLTDPSAKLTPLIDEFKAEYGLASSDGDTLWFVTDLDAPRSRLVSVNVAAPGGPVWKEVIPQSAHTLYDVEHVGGRFIARYLKDAHSSVRVFDVDGTFLRDVELPGLGSAWGFGGDKDDPETFFKYQSFTAPLTVYRYDVSTGKTSKLWQPDVDFDPDQFVTKQVFYKSKDGTRVPMFICHKKGLKLNGQAPTYLYGYGGFNISLTPRFSVARLVWMEMGGVVAIANIRGGGEYGKEWHEAAIKTNRQKAFDDFIAAAEWLIDNNYTSTPKLAISGGSNGGTLVGACMTQRPELFGACIPEVGVMDMLRFHKFTIGWGWVSDFGSPDDPEEFKAIYAYSPLHNLKPGTSYPPTLVTTADHDDRVVPAHSFKFAAELQHCQAGEAPVLIRIQTKAGHGAGMPTEMIIDEYADFWAFLVDALDM